MDNNRAIDNYGRAIDAGNVLCIDPVYVRTLRNRENNVNHNDLVLYGSMSMVILNLETGRRMTEQCVRADMQTHRYSPFSTVLLNITYQDVREFVDVIYDLKQLDGLYVAQTYSGKLGLRFASPKHSILIIADHREYLATFFNNLRYLIDQEHSLNLDRKLDQTFDPHFDRYETVCRLADADNMMLLYENIITSIPVVHGERPITHLCLSGVCIGNTIIEQEQTWNAISTLWETLEILEINSAKLQIVPLEIRHLIKLRSLSLVNNKLKYIPNFIGYLQKLRSLYVNDNKLKYLPSTLLDKTFLNLNISGNKFHRFQMPSIQKKTYSVCKSLASLSFSCLMLNNIQLRREDVPRPLWFYFNKFGRCALCKRMLTSEYIYEKYDYSAPKSLNIFENPWISWQSVECLHLCI